MATIPVTVVTPGAPTQYEDPAGKTHTLYLNKVRCQDGTLMDASSIWETKAGERYNAILYKSPFTGIETLVLVSNKQLKKI